MAGELQIRYDYTGRNMYATIQHLDGRYWDAVNTVLETLVPGDWGNYDIALSESPASGYFYIGNWPAGLAAGWYRINYHERVGASPAISDPLIQSVKEWYDGTVLMPAPFDSDGAVQVDFAQVNTTETDATHWGAQLRRVHALAGGNKVSRDHSATDPAWVHRDEADSGNLVTLTRTVASSTETVTPS